MMMIFMIHVMIMMIVMVMEVVIIGYGDGEQITAVDKVDKLKEG